MFWSVIITIFAAIAVISSICTVYAAIKAPQNEDKESEIENKIIDKTASLAYREELNRSDLADIIKAECHKAQIDEFHPNNILSGAKNILVDRIDIYPNKELRIRAKTILDNLKDNSISERIKKKKLNRSIIVRLISVIIITAILTALMMIFGNIRNYNSINPETNNKIESSYQNNQINKSENIIIDTPGHVDFADHPMGGGEREKLATENSDKTIFTLDLIMLFSIIIFISILIIAIYLIVFYFENRKIKKRIINLNDRYSIDSYQNNAHNTGSETLHGSRQAMEAGGT